MTLQPICLSTSLSLARLATTTDPDVPFHCLFSCTFRLCMLPQRLSFDAKWWLSSVSKAALTTVHAGLALLLPDSSQCLTLPTPCEGLAWGPKQDL